MDLKGACLSHFQQEVVREELQRLLSCTHFSSSQRCRMLLGYVIDNALGGDVDSLKERSIGVAVFNRAPSYDTNNDPVVRTAAAEVRKRLAQCYYDPKDQPKVRIELPTGTYAPLFSFSETTSSEVEGLVPGPPGEPGDEPRTGSDTNDVSPPRWSRRVIGILIATFLVAVICSGLLYRQSHSRSKDAFNAFWAPFVKSSSPILICTGDMQLPPIQRSPVAVSRGTTPPLALTGTSGSENSWPVMPVQDSITLVNLALFLRSEEKAFTIREQEATSFDDLQKGPVIVLGANNPWAIRLMQPMRFHFVIDSASFKQGIVDDQKPGTEIGDVRAFVAESNSEDYVLIARSFEPHTQQPTIVIAGVTPVATHSAGTFLTNPVYLNDFAKKAPRNWETKNMEILLVTSNVNGDSGPPKVVDSFFW